MFLVFPVTFWIASGRNTFTGPNELDPLGPADFFCRVGQGLGLNCFSFRRSRKTVCRIVVANSRETKSDEFDFNNISCGSEFVAINVISILCFYAFLFFAVFFDNARAGKTRRMVELSDQHSSYQGKADDYARLFEAIYRQVDVFFSVRGD
jgi:hypothetical protein